MNHRIIFPVFETNGVAVVVPAPECGLTIEEIAVRTVPPSTPYKIVDVSEIPADRTFRSAWEYQDIEPALEEVLPEATA